MKTITLVLLLLVVSLPAQERTLPRATPEEVGLNSSVLTQATSFLNQQVTERRIAGAVAAVARNGRVAYMEAVGVQDLESRTPMTDRSLFRIYSMTKSVTAVAVMMLHEEGKFQLSDPVSKYLPEFARVHVRAADGSSRPPSQPITVQDLLLHTSGLSHRTSELYRTERVRSRRDTLPQFVANVVKAPLMEDPGTRYRYSEGTTVLGRLVEVWSGQTFEAFLQSRVLDPLGMADTMFWVRPEQRARLTTVYGPSQDGGLTPIEIEEVPVTERPALIEGAVGLVSTVPDFLRFSQMLLNGGELGGRRLLTAKTVATMTGNGLSEAVLKSRGGSMGWGLANVNVVMDERSPLKGEYGWDGTAGTIFWVDPARSMITILMTQSSPANPGGIRQGFKKIVQQAIVN